MNATNFLKQFTIKILILSVLAFGAFSLTPATKAQNGEYCGEKCVYTDDEIAGCLVNAGATTACALWDSFCDDVECDSQ